MLNKVEDLIQMAKSSNDAMDLLVSNVLNISVGILHLARCYIHKKNMRILLVTKFEKKYKYIRQMMFDQREGVKE
jgi:hypothetical protein